LQATAVKYSSYDDSSADAAAPWCQIEVKALEKVVDTSID
jgi:hypothetical protein